MKARRRVAGRVSRRGWVGGGLMGLVAAAALSGCSGPFHGTLEECPSDGSCADARSPQGDALSGPVRCYDGDDPVGAARELSVTPAWAAAPRGKDCGSVALIDYEALEAAQKDCLAAAVKSGEAAHAGWWASTTEGDPIVTLAQTSGSKLTVVEINAFDSYGGNTTAPAQGFTCSAPAAYLAEPGSQTGAQNPGRCARD
jgi:hypothetical protein